MQTSTITTLSAQIQKNQQSTPNNNQIMTFKVVILGDRSVGKTSIVKRYTDNEFSVSQESTIGAQFFSKIIELPILVGGQN